MENKAMYLSTYEERESGSMYEEAYDGHNLSKLNLCDEGSGKRRRKQDQCCAHLNSLSAIKYAIVSLYILVLLTIFGLCLADKRGRVKMKPRGQKMKKPDESCSFHQAFKSCLIRTLLLQAYLNADRTELTRLVP
ncbi:hypothetical protein KUCAC02_020142 [Chaenocephalus aceratus]|uniref:Uncharacterized protein n=1 Tax=Chaenocephalus aceratus TaxID=36190 RepID=A0ACB9VQV8_CHAAC|nr:hypothetical protein KUCAC02_020142 [Chaenocephalus aceratus]